MWSHVSSDFGSDLPSSARAHARCRGDRVRSRSAARRRRAADWMDGTPVTRYNPPTVPIPPLTSKNAYIRPVNANGKRMYGLRCAYLRRVYIRRGGGRRGVATGKATPDCEDRSPKTERNERAGWEMRPTRRTLPRAARRAAPLARAVASRLRHRKGRQRRGTARGRGSAARFPTPSERISG